MGRKKIMRDIDNNNVDESDNLSSKRNSLGYDRSEINKFNTSHPTNTDQQTLGRDFGVNMS